MNRSRDEEPGESSGRLGSFYAYKDTFNEDNVWVEVPKNGRSARLYTSRHKGKC
jgi:hypothetical protein